jgi:hypothetical protein
MAKGKRLFFSGIDTLLGWYGMGAILMAYALNSLDVLRADDWVYQALNLTGATGIAVISITKKAYQPAALNIIWGIVAVIALLKTF